MIKDTVELATGDDLFEMTNVFPEDTGLPFVVYISEKGTLRHDVRVKVASGPKGRDFVASVSVRAEVEVVGGALDAGSLALVRRWIELNRDVIVRYWDVQFEPAVRPALKPFD
jgi:hypothetical protein